MRLGLSATPERYYETTTPDNLTDYYGAVADTYSLADALRDKVLTPYAYKIITVELTPEEAEQYEELSEQIARLAGSQGLGVLEQESDDQLKLLLFKRSRLLGSAQNKLEVLNPLLKDIPQRPFTLFYCGDGSVEDEDIGESVRQVEATALTLHELDGVQASSLPEKELSVKSYSTISGSD